MTKGNRKTPLIADKPPTTLMLVKQESPRIDGESEQEFNDRAVVSAYHKLSEINERNPEQEKEFQAIRGKYIAAHMTKGGYLPAVVCDEHLRLASNRMHEELQQEFGSKSVLKNILIDRLICAWNAAYSYELLFKGTKYSIEKDRLQYSHGDKSIKFMKELRRGIESSNEQIVRLAQALHTLSAPPVQIKATNAFFAQNQQVNQAPPPNDLDKSPAAKNYEETTS